MKNIVLGAIVLTVLATSCKKRPDSCIDGPTEVEPGSTHTYTYCGDAKDPVITWQVNGVEKTGESIEVTFEGYGASGTTVSIYQDVEVKTWGTTRSGEDASINVTLVDKTPTLCIKARDYFYDQGLTSIEGLANATIKLYSSQVCWQDISTTETCLIAEATADENGVACFEGLDPEGSFIVDVIYDNYYTNWNSNIRYMEIADWATLDGLNTGGYNSSYTEISPYYANSKPSSLYHLTSASKWQLSDMMVNDSSTWNNVNDCSKDNYLTFNRDLTWSLHEGTNVCTSDQTSNGTFAWPSTQGTPTMGNYYFSMVTESGAADFSSSTINVEASTNDMIFTSYSGGNTVKVIYSRVN